MNLPCFSTTAANRHFFSTRTYLTILTRSPYCFASTISILLERRWIFARRADSVKRAWLPRWGRGLDSKMDSKRSREPLKNSPIHRLRVYGVRRGEKANATANFGGAYGVREVRAEVEAGAISRGDGAGGAVGGVTGAGGTALSERRERAASGGPEPHVAGVLSAAVVQSERSGGGGCAV